jgi:MOSC domain-containing protein YiiM
MSSGTIEWIHLVAEEGGEPEAVPAADAIAGFGLEGDRNVTAARARGETGVEAKTQLTLIEAEAIEAADREHGIAIAPGVSRRNITVRGLGLNAAVGRTLRVGGALVRGIELCHPCGYLERTTGIAGITRSLVDRGGLRCEILEGGRIAVGDPVAVLDDADDADGSGSGGGGERGGG